MATWFPAVAVPHVPPRTPTLVACTSRTAACSRLNRTGECFESKKISVAVAMQPSGEARCAVGRVLANGVRLGALLKLWGMVSPNSGLRIEVTDFGASGEPPKAP